MAGRDQTTPTRRPYHSPARRRQAEETRRRILDAARALFREEGYAGTTLDAIAAAAEVSPKTVAALGSKRGILAALVDPVGPGRGYREFVESMLDAPGPERYLEVVAQFTRRVYETSAPEFDLLRSAGAVAPEVAEAARQVETRRRQHQERLIAILSEQGVLRGELGRKEATDVLWALTSYDLYRALVGQCSWAPENYEAWLTGMLIQRLLAPR